MDDVIELTKGKRVAIVVFKPGPLGRRTLERFGTEIIRGAPSLYGVLLLANGPKGGSHIVARGWDGRVDAGRWVEEIVASLRDGKGGGSRDKASGTCLRKTDLVKSKIVSAAIAYLKKRNIIDKEEKGGERWREVTVAEKEEEKEAECISDILLPPCSPPSLPV